MTARVSSEQLAEWSRLAEAATAGPWSANDASEWLTTGPKWEVVFVAPEDDPLVGGETVALANYVDQADAEFIAAARAAVPTLVAEVERLRQELALSEGEREDLDTGAGTLLGENVELEADLEQARGRLATVRALVDREVHDDVEASVRRARADVRCLDCNLRYEERQEYGCHEEGRGHTYDDGDLEAAEQLARDEPGEYVTISIAEFRAATEGPAAEPPAAAVFVAERVTCPACKAKAGERPDAALPQPADGFPRPWCHDCGPGYRLGDDGCRHTGKEPALGDTGICRTCALPIWFEEGEVGHRKQVGWSDRIERGGDSLVCFKAVGYRHVPMGAREAAIYQAGVTAGENR